MINGTERYKEAINHMCSLKCLIRYSENHMWLSTYSAWQQNLQFSALPQMLDGEFYENVQNRCTEKHICFIFQ